MKVQVIKEAGYEEAVLGFSLSYNSALERVQEILPKYAFGVPGEGKFLESMVIYLDVTAPRYWWQEADTYRVGSTKQSESTMHTLMKRGFVIANDFEGWIHPDLIYTFNKVMNEYKWAERQGYKEKVRELFLTLKGMLPEAYLQRRIWMISYKTLQNIYNQRYNHKLPQWRLFLDTILGQIQHPEFIVK